VINILLGADQGVRINQSERLISTHLSDTKEVCLCFVLSFKPL